MNWISVDAKAMNIDKEPSTDLERQVAEELKKGKNEFDSHTDLPYQFAGASGFRQLA